MPKIQPIDNKPVEHLLGPEITAERRECRLFATLSGLVVRPRSHKGVGGQLARSSRGSQAMDVDLSNDAGWRRSPLLKPLDGKMSDKVSLLEAICTIQRQL